MNKQLQSFSFSSPINLIEEGKWLLGVPACECTNSVFNITNENNNFSISIPGRWRIPNSLEDGVIEKLKNLLKVKSQKDIELQVREVRKTGDKMKVQSNEYSFSDFDTTRKKIHEELKNVSYHDLENLIYRMQLTYGENMDILDINYFPPQRTSYTLPPGIYEVSDFNRTLQYLLPDIVKVSITIDDNRLGSNLNIIQTLIFNK